MVPPEGTLAEERGRQKSPLLLLIPNSRGGEDGRWPSLAMIKGGGRREEKERE